VVPETALIPNEVRFTAKMDLADSATTPHRDSVTIVDLVSQQLRKLVI
jgi:hypothetical protein